MYSETTSTGSGSDLECSAGVRLVVLNLPEDEGEGLGFRLTRTLWDPYPWVREVTPASRADHAGLKTGDCLLQADGRDLLGLPVGQVAGLIRGDGAGRGVSLLVWNCGVDPRDDPELLWSCGGGSRGERSRRALSGVVKALACCVCASTATKPLSCARSHLYCEACWTRLERCALCRETLPAKDSQYARNLVAEQVFEAIAVEYEIKDAMKKPTQSASSSNLSNCSPNMSPTINRKGQYQLSMMNRKKTVQFNEKFGPSYASDPNIHRSSQQQPELNINRQLPKRIISTNTNIGNTSLHKDNKNSGKTACTCQKSPTISEKNIQSQNPQEEKSANCCNSLHVNPSSCQNLLMQHKLVARLRPACSLVDLQNSGLQTCGYSRSLNNINRTPCMDNNHHTGSLDDLKNNNCTSNCDSPVLLLAPQQPIYVLTYEHSN
ncbi:hypothetical protein JYU34_008308 [Plutella xylostella]|uniref:PDZ domain-containing protein n=1 Tax=Plutella xylostella TaxID=51655 RepID=A0ABQ7QP75_PLUXY|nr:hypothetical protein JYU34_008308 [Plutella xylostella]